MDNRLAILKNVYHKLLRMAHPPWFMPDDMEPYGDPVKFYRQQIKQLQGELRKIDREEPIYQYKTTPRIMKYFESFNTEKLLDFMETANKDLFIAMPALHAEIEEMLYYMQSGNVAIHILLDFDPQTFRQGYGKFSSVVGLLEAGIEVKQLKDNRVSFIIADEVGYYLFMESRTLIPAEKETINAVKIDPVSLVRLKKYFFADVNPKALADELANAIITESQTLKNPESLMADAAAPVKEISEEEVETVHADLKKNPPLNPDYTRIVSSYSSKFQYVKMRFIGANLNNLRVSLPKNALPVNDATLRKRLETKLKLFDGEEIDRIFAPLAEIKDKVEGIRAQFLYKAKLRDESILERSHKDAFEKEVKTLETEITSIHNSMLEGLASQISETQNSLREDLILFLNANPKSLFPESPEYWTGKESSVALKADNVVNDVMSNVKWPEPEKLLKSLSINIDFSDITWEDLNKREFIEELFEAGLISGANKDELASYSDSIALRP